MSSYLNSFLISFVLYASIFGFILYESREKTFCDKKHDNVTRVSISVINNQPIVKKDKLKPEKIVKKKAHKKESEKIDKVVKKEVLPIQKQIPKKVIEVAKKEIKEEPQKQPKKEETANVEEQAAKKAISTKITKTVNKDVIKAKQDIFLANLVRRINSNKSYPNSARRRAIQGEVEMRFFLLESGYVKDINLVSGKHIFKRSAIEAIEKSFPVDVDKTLFNFPKEFKITIAYILK